MKVININLIIIFRYFDLNVLTIIGCIWNAEQACSI